MHILKKRIRYKGNFYRVGDKVAIDSENLDEFIKRGVISGHTEKNRIDRIQLPVKDESAVNAQLSGVHKNLSIPEIKIILDNKGIEYTSDMRKAELLELLGSD